MSGCDYQILFRVQKDLECPNTDCDGFLERICNMTDFFCCNKCGLIVYRKGELNKNGNK